jgi:hypothetical protein
MNPVVNLWALLQTGRNGADMDKRLVLKTLGAAVAVGVIIGTSPSIFGTAAGFNQGPRGAQLSAEAASPRLRSPLSADQQQELMQGLLYVVKDQYADAARVLGRYAMLGEPNAQMQIGALYYFGKGVPLNRDESIRWLRLSAAQGSTYGQEALSAAMSGTWAWEGASDHSFPRYADSSSALQYDDSAAHVGFQGGVSGDAPYASSGTAFASPQPSYGNPYQQQFSYNDPTSGSRIGDLASPSATAGSSNVGAINIRSGQYMAPAGPDGYVDPRNGTFYAPSGPDGVVNTRTGEYSPVSH